MVNYPGDELMDVDIEPETESLWRTSSAEAEDKKNMEMGSLRSSWEMQLWRSLTRWVTSLGETAKGFKRRRKL